LFLLHWTKKAPWNAIAQVCQALVATVSSYLSQAAVYWLADKIAGTDDYADPEFGGWKRADELVRQFTKPSISLARALLNLLPIHKVNKQENQPIPVTVYGARAEATASSTFLSDLVTVSPMCTSVEEGDPATPLITFQRTSGAGRICRCVVGRAGDTVTVKLGPVWLAPQTSGPFE